MRVRLIGKANGVGLSRDIELLGAALRSSGCEVQELPCDRRERRRRRSVLAGLAARLRRRPRSLAGAHCDVNVMLEHVWPQFLHEAPLNVLVPNPEWFDRHDEPILTRVDRVWAKTAVASQIFSARGCRTVHIGFDSEDRFLGQIARAPQFLHLAGRSELKGTSRLLEVWQRHPEWPQLTVIQDAAAVTTRHRISAANVRLERDYLDDATLRTLQNSHRFHLCLSEAEGWGHYIAEAMSVAAVTLTCDAAPMNELVSAQRGVLVAARDAGRQHLARRAQFAPAALERAVAELQTLEPRRLDGLGSAARQWFLDNKHEFPARVQRAVEDLHAELQRVIT